MPIRSKVNSWGLPRFLLRHLLELVAALGGLFGSADKPGKKIQCVLTCHLLLSDTELDIQW